MMPACEEPVTLQTTIVSKKTPRSRLLLPATRGPVGETEAAERVVGGTGRDRVGVPPARSTSSSARCQLSLNSMPKPTGSSRTSAPMIRDSRMLPTLSFTESGQFDPSLLHQHGLEAELGRDGGDLPGVVGLDTADGHQGVRALGERIRDEVLELAGLVAAVGQPGVARPRVSPRSPPRRGAGSAGPRVDRARPEGQRVSGKILNGHEPTYSEISVLARSVSGW